MSNEGIRYGITLDANAGGLNAAFSQSEQGAQRLTDATQKAGAATQAAFSQAEQSARKLVEASAQGSAATTAALGRIENSAKQTTQAMRQLPMQMTDIVTSLAAGQSPMMVFMQQGGQLKDTFGGVGNAAKALAGYLYSTTTAVVGGAAAVGALAYAAYEGDQQIKSFNRALELTGGYAGVTEARYTALAGTLQDRVRVSASSAREALNALTASGQFQGRAFDEAALASTRLAKLTGESAAEIVQDFAGMQNGVAKWAAEHNRQYNFITAAQYQHIKSLEDAGRTQEAMSVTLAALNEHLGGQERKLGAIDGLLERIKLGWSGWVEATRALGSDTTADRLTNAYERLNKAMAARQAWRDKTGGMASPTADAEVAALQAEVQRIVGEQNKKSEDAATKARDARVQQEGVAAARELEIAQRKYDRKKALADELAAYERNVAKVQAAGGAVPSEADQSKAKAAIREQYRDKSGDQAGKEAANQKYRAELAAQEGLQAREADALRAHLSQLDALRQQGAISEEAAIARRLQLQQESLDKQIASAEAQAAIARGKGKPGDAEKYDQDAERLRAQRAEAERQTQTELVTLQVRRTNALQDWISAQNDALEQQQFEASLIGKTADEQARLTRNRQIDLQVRNATRNSDGSLKVDEGTEAAYKSAGAGVKAAPLPASQDAWRQGDWSDGAKKGLEEFKKQAGTTAEASAQAFSAMANKSSAALANFVTTGKFNFKDFARSILADLAQIYAKQMVVWAIKTATGYASGGTVEGAVTANAKGNVFGPSGLKPFALGGATGTILDRPTFFAFNSGGSVGRGLAGESGDELIAPIKKMRNGEMGVKAIGGGGTVVNVYGAEGTKVSTRERQDGDQTIIDVFFEQMEASLASGIGSGNGALTQALEQTYGLNRAASGR